MSRRKFLKRAAKWARYMEQTSRSSVRHYDFPFGLSVKTTPGYFGRSRDMSYRGSDYYTMQKAMAAFEKEG